MVQLVIKDFFDEIIQNEAVATHERFNEPGNILLSLHRNGCQLQFNPQCAAQVYNIF